MTVEELKAEYHKIDADSRKWLSKVNSIRDYESNAHATIMMNAHSQIKNHILMTIGKKIVEEKTDKE